MLDRRQRGRAAAGVTLATLLLAAAPPICAAPPTAQELAWGEILFDFYQQNHVQAITRSLVARDRAELETHSQEAELVLGGLYLDYGMHDRAAGIFERLLADQARPSVRDQAWYYLAHIRFMRGDVDTASAALGRIGDALPRRLYAARIDLESRVLLAQDRPDVAAQLLAGAELEGSWQLFGWYNLGVALVRADRLPQGIEMLDRVGQARVRGSEMTTLQDRANLALGYARLAAGDEVGARDALNRVRLDSPYTTKALLGAGWADAGRDDYENALVPWRELGDRDAFDVAVQESLLAVPFAYSELGANGQAVEHYHLAVDAYEAELVRLELAVARVGNGRLAEDVIGSDDGLAGDNPLQRYLYEMMASHAFREAASDLRNLDHLSGLLETRAEGMAALQDMLDTRRARYRSRQASIDTNVAGVRLADMVNRHQQQGQSLERIRHEGDAMALARPAEAAMKQRLDRVGEVLARRPDLVVQAKRQRFLEGVLYWQVHSEFPARLHASEKTHRATGRAIEEIRSRQSSLERARTDEPPRFSNFEERVAVATTRLQALRTKTDRVIVAQSDYLAGLATTELLARKERIAGYLVQARFALAASYDRAAVAEVTE